MAITGVTSARQRQPEYERLRRRLERNRDRCDTELRRTPPIDADSGVDLVGETYRALLDGLLFDTVQALRRMDDGTYGMCSVCGGPIPSERLELIPQAAACVGCPPRWTGVR